MHRMISIPPKDHRCCRKDSCFMEDRNHILDQPPKCILPRSTETHRSKHAERERKSPCRVVQHASAERGRTIHQQSKRNDPSIHGIIVPHERIPRNSYFCLHENLTIFDGYCTSFNSDSHIMRHTIAKTLCTITRSI